MGAGKFRRLLWHLIAWPLAIVILFEEWGWETLESSVKWFLRLPFFARLEKRVAKLSPYAALALFFLPSLLFFPVKIGALALIAEGHAFLGFAIIATIKVVGTAVFARFFTLTLPALLTIEWFAALYGRWTLWKSELLGLVYASYMWRKTRVAKEFVGRVWRDLRSKIKKSRSKK